MPIFQPRIKVMGKSLRRRAQKKLLAKDKSLTAEDAELRRGLTWNFGPNSCSWCHCGIKLLTSRAGWIIIVPGSVSGHPRMQGCGQRIFENSRKSKFRFARDLKLELSLRFIEE